MSTQQICDGFKLSVKTHSYLDLRTDLWVHYLPQLQAFTLSASAEYLIDSDTRPLNNITNPTSNNNNIRKGHS